MPTEATKLKTYWEEYNEFIREYKTGQVSAELIGELIGRLSSYYCVFNLKLVDANKKLFIVAGDIEARTDDNGKVISSSKAQSYVNATEENFQVLELKAHLENLETFISALRSIQRGVLNEYSFQSSN